MLNRRAAVLLLVLASPPAGNAQSSHADSSRACAPSTSVAVAPQRVPITLINNHVYVRVCVGGRELDFILDTGAGASFLDLGTAKQIGIRTLGSFRARGAGAGSIDAAMIDSTRVYVGSDGNGGNGGSGGGPSVLARSALDMSGVSLGEGFQIQGILGYDFIAGRVLGIDYQKRELLLYDAKTFAEAGAEAGANRSAIPIIAMTRNHPHVRIDVILADGTRLPATAIVDVGSSLALGLTKPFIERYNLRSRITPTIRTLAGGGVGGAAMADVGRVAALQMGPFVLERPVTLLFGDSAGVFSTDSVWDANVGGEFLRRFRVFFDYGNKRMFLEQQPMMSEPFEGDMSGLKLRAEVTLDHLLVMFVLAASPADEAGLRVSDQIVAVDGQRVTDSTLRELRERLRRPGERVSLTILRGAERRDVTLTTRRLI